MFIGLLLAHHRHHIARSTIEGVIYSLRNAYETLKSVMKSEPDRIIASGGGGGARGELILQMEVDIIGKSVYTTTEAEQACIGAALSAAVDIGFYESYSEACGKVIRFNSRVLEPIESKRKSTMNILRFTVICTGSTKESLTAIRRADHGTE